MSDTPTPIVECDLTDNGTFETDISAYVYGFPLIEFGRQASLDPVSPRKLTLVLDNEDSRFTPKNASSPYNSGGKTWTKDKPIRVKGVVPMAAVATLNDQHSFETGMQGAYDLNGASLVLAQDTTKARYGKACLKITAWGAANQLGLRMRDGSNIPVTAGNDYMIKLAMQTPDTIGALLVRIDWRDSGDSHISYSAVIMDIDSFPTPVGNPPLSQDKWLVLFSSSAEAPGGAVGARVEVIAQIGTGQTGYFDGFMFYEGTADVDYCDGSLPGHSWSGTAHESTASRPADPTFTLLTGFITDIKVSRAGKRYICTVEAMTQGDYLLSEYVSMGSFVQQPTEIAFNRIMDVLEDGEIIDNGAFLEDKSVSGYNWAGSWGAGARTNPGLEGYYGLSNTISVAPAVDEGWYLTVTSDTAQNGSYRVVVGIRNLNNANMGKQITLRMTEGIGRTVVASVTVTLVDSPTWLYVVLEGTYGTEINRFIEVMAAETWAAADWVITDIHHMVPLENKIPRDYRGAGSTQEHVAAYRRSARPLLEDLARSAGGILYEAGDGTFILEDYSYRAADPIPLMRVTDAIELDGLVAADAVYGERQDASYTQTVVYSDGDLVDVPGASGIVWELDPLPVMAADEVKRYYVHYPLTDVGGQIVVMNESTVVTVATGSATVQFIPYGVGADLIITAGGSGATFTTVRITGFERQLQSTRSRVYYTPAGASSRRFRRTLRIDMPMQGTETALMSTIAQKIGDKHLEGHQAINLKLEALTAEQWLYALGLGMGDAINLRNNYGAGNLGLNERYEIEGGVIIWRADKRRYKLETTFTVTEI